MKSSVAVTALFAALALVALFALAGCGGGGEDSGPRREAPTERVPAPGSELAPQSEEGENPPPPPGG